MTIFNPSIINDPESATLLIETAEELGKTLASKEVNLGTAQIRALFGEVRLIQAQWSISNQAVYAQRRMILLKPKMAYRVRRERGQGVKILVSFLNPALDQVILEKDPKKQQEKFDRFVEFFEAILAYHKSYGGN